MVEKAQIDESFGYFVFEEWMNYFVEEGAIVVFYIGVQLVADFVVEGFELLLLGVGVPVGDPVFKGSTFDLSKASNIAQSDS